MPDPIDQLLEDLAQQDAASAEVAEGTFEPNWAEMAQAMGMITPAPSVFSGLCDPSWKTISASLRKDPLGVPSLYLKLPNSVLREVILGISFGKVEARMAVEDSGEVGDFSHLDELLTFLKGESGASGAPSIFLRIPAKDAEKDIQALKVVQELACADAVKDFVGALECGLRNDPSRDWIARCGGPACNVSLDQTNTCKGSCSASDNASPSCCGAEILGLPE